MLTFAIVFPDERSFYPGMGLEIFEQYPRQVSRFYRAAQHVGGVPIVDALLDDYKPEVWDRTSRQIAVLCTSLAIHQVWRDEFHLSPVCYSGSGVGFLSALCAAGKLALFQTILALRTGTLPSRLFAGNGDIYGPSCGKQLLTSREISQELRQALSFSPVALDPVSLPAEAILDMGPGNQFMFTPDEVPQQIYAMADRAGDSAWTMELLQERKHGNAFFGILRMSALMAASPDCSADSPAEIEESYDALYRILGEILHKGGEPKAGEDKLEEAWSHVVDHLLAKGLPPEEILRRRAQLCGEILLPLKEPFV